MRKFLLYLFFAIILVAFFADIYFFILFNEGIKDLTKIREASSILKKVSMDSMKIYSGLDVSSSIEELKIGKVRFMGFLRENKNIRGINHDALSSLWEEAEINIDLLAKNERDSKDFFKAYHEINNLICPVINEFELSQEKLGAEIRSDIIKFGIINLILIFSLPLFFLFLQRKARFDLKRKKLGIKILLENMSKEVEELSDEIEEISTKTIKLSLRKSESEYSNITNSLEEMRKRIDSFIKESFVKEEEDYRKSLNSLIDSLSLSLNSIIASTIMEMEKFKDMEKGLEKISAKISLLKRKFAEFSLSLKTTRDSLF